MPIPIDDQRMVLGIMIPFSDLWDSLAGRGPRDAIHEPQIMDYKPLRPARRRPRAALQPPPRKTAVRLRFCGFLALGVTSPRGGRGGGAPPAATKKTPRVVFHALWREVIFCKTGSSNSD